MSLIYAYKLHAGTDRLERCRSDLIQLLHDEQGWIKVHAAEYLLQLGEYREGIASVFHKEDSLYGDVPAYRIGIWRVLAQTDNEEIRSSYLGRIKAVFYDTSANDRLHAIETLAKLREPLSLKDSLVSEALQSRLVPMMLYTKWNAAYHSVDMQRQVSDELAMMLLDGKSRLSVDEQKTACYVIRQLDRLSIKCWQALHDFALSELSNSPIKVTLYSTLYKTKPRAIIDRVLKNELEAVAIDSPDVITVLTVLCAKGSADDRAHLERFYLSLSNRALPHYDADKHAASAYALYSLAYRIKMKEQ
ncbi:hypothetical protein H8S90_08290 [Olivibacter sp. SDN3]|uniref:hypothetical protein n=1 Tax=Olivibacter sp. SDN3 TaxID=2764720 RepID=UPI0016516916|nr:hypothetical protein [Olivibacter sp. SDN3]QNL51556.1 hypothetical protein H8S90_08290 [Olivibacter sp. SDN3]